MTLQPTRPLDDHPFELLIGFAAALGGAAAALGIVSPTSINASLPLPVVRAWGVLQAAAGVCMIIGIVVRYRPYERVLFGWRIERAGLWPLAATALVYALVAVIYAGAKAATPAAFYVATAVAFSRRARRVTHLEAAVRARGDGHAD